MSNIQKKIGVCPQEDLIYDELSGYEHAFFYSLCRGRSWFAAREEALAVLASVTLQEHAEKRAKAYSGGMKRRLMAGLATVGDPEYVFLDEPSTGLDPLSRRR
jgi:ABC-type multidrug transport system ATPase subunit